MDLKNKRLYRSRYGKLCGVCAGVAEYFDIDPTLVRIAWIIFGFTGAGIIAYFVAAFVMPYEDASK